MSNSNQPNLGQVSKLNTSKDAVTEKLIFSLENRVGKSKVSRKSSLFLLKKDLNVAKLHSQVAITCSKSTIETLEKSVKYLNS